MPADADRDAARSAGPAQPARPAGAGPGLPGPRETGGAGPYRILLVCLGNICRSPMAEVILRDELDQAGLAGQVTVESAGTGDWHTGGPMDDRARAELGRRGYDGSAHIARQIQPPWLPNYDLFIVMDGKNLANLRQMAAGNGDGPGDGPAGERIYLMRAFDPAAGPDAEVPDPYHGGPAEYAETFELVHAAARGLAGQLAGRLHRPA
jgi:protein-tyrosine phosphatase